MRRTPKGLLCRRIDPYSKNATVHRAVRKKVLHSEKRKTVQACRPAGPPSLTTTHYVVTLQCRENRIFSIHHFTFPALQA